MQEDLLESRNLIANEKYAGLIQQMRERLFDVLEQTGGMEIPLQRDRGAQQNLRSPEKAKAVDFLEEMKRKPALSGIEWGRRRLVARLLVRWGFIDRNDAL